MPIDHEDRTDISGLESAQHPPFRPPSQRAADQARSHKYLASPGPKPEDIRGAVGGAFSALGSKARDVTSGADSAIGDVSSELGLGQPDSWWNPIDWASQHGRDPSTVWGFARDVMMALTANPHDGLANIFGGQDAKAWLGEQWQKERSWDAEHSRALRDFSLGGFKPFNARTWNPFGGLEAEVLDHPDRLLGPPAPPHQPGQVVPDIPGGGGVPVDPEATMNVAALTPVGAGVRGARAAQIGMNLGLPAAQAALHPDDQATNLAWLALGTLFSFGHLPPELRKAVGQAFGRWGEVEQDAQAAMRRKQAADEAMMDPAKLDRHVGDHIDRKLAEAESPTDTSQPFDLSASMPGEGPLRDPRAPISEMDAAAAGKAHDHVRALTWLQSELRSGLWATAEAGNPVAQILRAVAGHGRSLDNVWDHYFSTMQSMLGSTNVARRAAMMKAAEGDADVYRSLRPVDRAAVDSWGVLRSVLRMTSAGTKYAGNFVANWVPRLDEELSGEAPRVGRPSRATLNARERRRHRAVEQQLDPATGQMKFVQKFPTVQSTNQALRESRQSLTEHLLDSTQGLRSDLIEDPEAQAVRDLTRSDFGAARERAVRLANDHYPLKSEDFLANISRAARYQSKAILAQKGLNELKQSILQAEHPAGGGVVHRRAVVEPTSERQVGEFARQGYVRIPDVRFGDVMVDKGVADLLQRYLDTDFRLPGGLEKLADIERQAVRAIMFSPHVHGWNVLGRFGIATVKNPLKMIAYLKQGKALLPHQMDEVSHELRREAYQSGLRPPLSAHGWQSAFTDLTHAAFGDASEDLIAPAEGSIGKLRQMLRDRPHPYRAYEDGFWRMVNDFGVAMYHIERDNALARGQDMATARAWAARRANSWMGATLPEDTNPLLAKAGKLLAFAPNWWKSAFELAIPIYKRSGLFEKPGMAEFAAKSAIKTVLAAYAFSHGSGNLLNYALSGHLQSGNDPGHQNDLEVANPALLHALQALGQLPEGTDVNTGINPATGGKMYMKNWLATQEGDIEEALGFRSGQAGLPTLEDVEDGMTKFLAGRTSPLVSGTAAAMNIDLYHSATQGPQLRAEVPGTEAGHPGLFNAVLPWLYGVPGGQAYAQQIQRNMQQGGTDQNSLFGTTLPNGWRAFTKDIGNVGMRTIIAAALGINPPYSSAQRSRGTPMSDSDYQKLREAQQQYDQQTQVMSAELMSGRKSDGTPFTPYMWRQQHGDLARTHAAQVRQLFRGAPEYVHGSDGMSATWNQLYEDATNPDGTPDFRKLAESQAAFKAEHTPEEMAAMQTAMRKRDAKDPGQALYHKTVDSYARWQGEYAASHGIDVTTLRDSVSQYNSLYGDQAARSQYLRRHPELNRFFQATKNQFERTQDGLLYALFHNQSATVMRSLQARHLTVQDFLAEESAA